MEIFALLFQWTHIEEYLGNFKGKKQEEFITLLFNQPKDSKSLFKNDNLSKNDASFWIDISSQVANIPKGSLFSQEIAWLLWRIGFSFLHWPNNLQETSSLQQIVQENLVNLIEKHEIDVFSALGSQDLYILPFNLFLKHSHLKEKDFVAYLKRQIELRNLENSFDALSHFSELKVKESILIDLLGEISQIAFQPYNDEAHEETIVNIFSQFFTLINHDSVAFIEKCRFLYVNFGKFHFHRDELRLFLLNSLAEICFNNKKYDTLKDAFKAKAFSFASCEKHFEFLKQNANVEDCLEVAFESFKEESFSAIDCLLAFTRKNPQELSFSLLEEIANYSLSLLSSSHIGLEKMQRKLLQLLLNLSTAFTLSLKFQQICEIWFFQEPFMQFDNEILLIFAQFFRNNPKFHQKLLIQFIESCITYCEKECQLIGSERFLVRFNHLIEKETRGEILGKEHFPLVAQLWFCLFNKFSSFEEGKLSFQEDAKPFVEIASISTPSILFFGEEFAGKIHRLHASYSTKSLSIEKLTRIVCSTIKLPHKECPKDLEELYFLLISYHSQVNKIFHGKYADIFEKLLLEKPSENLKSTILASYKSLYSSARHFCDDFQSKVSEIFIFFLKKTVSRFEHIALIAYEICTQILIKDFMCCLSQDSMILQFIFKLLSKVEEASNLEWNERFDPRVNGESFEIDVFDDAKKRKKYYLQTKKLFMLYLTSNTSNFGIISHIYSILQDFDEEISSKTKKFILEHLLNLVYTDRCFRTSEQDISFVIKVLGTDKNEASESLFEKFSLSLASDPQFQWIYSFLNSEQFCESLPLAIWTSQMISYLVAVKPSTFNWICSTLYNAFSIMKNESRGIFSIPCSSDYIFNERIIPGPSSVNVFKRAFSSPSLPFIVLFENIQVIIERLQRKNEKVREICDSLIVFFTSSCSFYNKHPNWVPALLRIGEFLLFLDGIFHLNRLAVIEKFILSIWDTEIFDCRFSDAKSWEEEKKTFTSLLKRIELTASSSLKTKKLIILFLQHDIYRSNLWHQSLSTKENFKFEWDYKTCKEMISFCFTEHSLPKLGMNLFLRIHALCSNLSFSSDLANILVQSAAICPLSIKCPILLAKIASSKLSPASLFKLTEEWAILSPIQLIHFTKSSNSDLLQYASETLKKCYPAEDIFFYIPQIVQALKGPANGAQIAKELILHLAKRSFLFSHLIIWNMKANMALDDSGDKIDSTFAPILEDMIDRITQDLSGDALSFYEKEFSFFQKVTHISATLKPLIKCTKEEKKKKIDQELGAIPVEKGVYLPSNPESTVVGIDYTSGKPLQSAAKAPFMATFLIQQEGIPQIIRQSAIFKVGDDCRQDVLALQMINMFKMIFDSVGLPLYLYPYRVVATAPGCGVIEVIPEAISRDIMGRDMVNDLYAYFLQKFGGNEESEAFQQARQRFICSLAAYSIVSFVLSLKDRHNGNIMIDSQGHILHIDFGFILGICPGNLNFEGDGFKLTAEMVRLLDVEQSGQSEYFLRFQELVIKGYLAVRPWMGEFLKLVDMMADSGLPCLQKREEVMNNLKKRFAPDLSEFDAVRFMKAVIEKSADRLRTTIYDWYQFKTNKIPYNREKF